MTFLFISGAEIVFIFFKKVWWRYRSYNVNVKKDKEQHLLALESDTGGFTPRGFIFDTKAQYLK